MARPKKTQNIENTEIKEEVQDVEVQNELYVSVTSDEDINFLGKFVINKGETKKLNKSYIDELIETIPNFKRYIDLGIIKIGE